MVDKEADTKAPSTFCLKVMNLPDDSTAQEVRQLFLPYSDAVSVEVKQAPMIMNSPPPVEECISLFYGLVQFEDVTAAITAMKQLDGFILRGNQLA